MRLGTHAFVDICCTCLLVGWLVGWLAGWPCNRRCNATGLASLTFKFSTFAALHAAQQAAILVLEWG